MLKGNIAGLSEKVKKKVDFIFFWYRIQNKMERELIEKFNDGDQRAGEKLIEQNEPLVRSIYFRHYNVPSAFEEDIMQEGRIGLVEAFRRFKREKEETFNYYKSLWIRKKMSTFIKRNKKNWGLEDFSEIFSLQDSRDLANLVEAREFIGIIEKEAGKDYAEKKFPRFSKINQKLKNKIYEQN